jgi:hypothetical protein
MQLQCPGCRAKILAEDVSLGTRLAKCRACNNVFGFDAPPASAPEPVVVARPTKFRVNETPGEIEITWRWFNPAMHLFMAFFCTAWDSFLVFWYTHAFKSGAPWIFKVFPIGHLAIGVALTYVTLAGFWNRTTVRASRDRLTIQNGPLPFRRSLAFGPGELTRVHAQVRPNFSRNGNPVWRLIAVGRDGGEIPLLSWLDDETQAQYLAQKIGGFVGENL